MSEQEPSKRLQEANEELLRMRERYENGLPVHEELPSNSTSIPSGATVVYGILFALLALCCILAAILIVALDVDLGWLF
jgi:hypothetical protein